MKSFLKKITLGSQALSFDFTPVHTPKGEKFFIAVLGNEGKTFFEMKKDYYGHWFIVEPAPSWLLPAQLHLDAAIKSYTNAAAFN